MRAVLQRVTAGSVRVGEELVGQIERGLVILLGIGPGDDQATVEYLVRQIVDLRIFSDDQGKMNLSLQDVDGEALVVPQFTLYADTSRGNRPSFTGAAPPDKARKLVDTFQAELAAAGVPTQNGRFGAHMQVGLVNDGPVTIILDTEESGD